MIPNARGDGGGGGKVEHEEDVYGEGVVEEEEDEDEEGEEEVRESGGDTENSELDEPDGRSYAMLFLCADVVFCALYLTAFWFEMSMRNGLLSVLALLALLGYYPLWTYVQQWKARDFVADYRWHHDYEYRPVLYAASRVFMYTAFVLASIIDAAGVDVWHTISQRFSALTLVACVGMLSVLLALVALATALHLTHARRSRIDLFDIASRCEVVLHPAGRRNVASAASVTHAYITSRRRSRKKSVRVAK